MTENRKDNELKSNNDLILSKPLPTLKPANLSKKGHLKTNGTVYIFGNINKAILNGINVGYCRWEIILNNWSLVSGTINGQSNVCHANKNNFDWSNLFEFELKSQFINQTPKMMIEIYSNQSNKAHFCYVYILIFFIL